VLPLGSTEQHGYLSLGTDNILAERVAVEAAESLGVPVLPVLAYGITPGFAAYPGSPTVRAETYLRVIGDLLESLYGQGFHRVLIVNGHGGNTPARAVREEWMADHEGAQAIWHDVWDGRRVDELAEALGEPEHANWSENFPWTRLEGVDLPSERKQLVLHEGVRARDPRELRETLGDGTFGGLYARADDEMLLLWQLAVEDTRDLLEHGWRV
jgi:creatinine amidohydrolase